MSKDNGVRSQKPRLRREEHSIWFLLDGVTDYLHYTIDLEDAERLKRAFEQYVEERRDMERFFYFISKDGTHVILSLADLQMVNFLFDYVRDDLPDEAPEPEIEAEPDEESYIEVFFRDRPQPFRVLPSDPLEIGEMLIHLDAAGTMFTAIFTDFDQEPVYLAPAHIVLITVPGDMVELEV